MKHKNLLKSILSVMLITLMTVVAISCGDDVEDPVIYTVTVMTAEGGTADASCYEVIAGEEVTLVATPESGYRFKCWMLNGKEVSTQNPYTVVVGKNTVYVAKFVKEGTEDEEEGDENEGENNEDAPSKIETFDVLSEIEKDEMIFVKGGSFKMGATSEQTEDAKADESPVHLVILSDYYISRYEVTQKFWETIMGNNPSSTKGDDLPVDNVSWEECQQFIKKLNAKTGKRYSLPTEAEWEYAARGGDKTENYKFSGSNTASEVAWSDAIDGTIETVGTKKYNELGIYDMSGNVSELCYNYYEAYTADDQVNPIGKTIGDKRVVRGGNISSASLNCRVSTRTTIAQTEKQAKTGFRLVLSKPTYEVSVKPSSEELGSVTIAGTTNTQYIREGGEVTLTATPKENCNFHNWTVNGEEVSKEATYTIKVTKDAEYIANFVTHKVTVVSGEGGTAETSKTQVEDNEKITLTATPKEGYSFVNWTVNGKEVSTDNPYTVAVTSDIEYKANFISYKVTVVAGEGGTAKASKTQVGHNGQVTLTATPNEGYSFVNWTLNGEEVSTSATYTATITADTEFKANFISYKVSVVSGEGGTATANKTQVGHNEQVTLTATPNEDYSFVNWTVNGVEVSTSATYTATITSDTELNANFIKNKENGHVYVDLGLSVKWATSNVSNEKFLWGYTSELLDYEKYINVSSIEDSPCNTSLKYVSAKVTEIYDEYGFCGYDMIIDYYTPSKLSKNSDVANKRWGGNWRMPTKEEYEELLDNCIFTREYDGYRATSKKNNRSIFFPFVKYYRISLIAFTGGYELGIYGVEYNTEYWCSDSQGEKSSSAYSFAISSSPYITTSSILDALPVRPVCE